MVSLALFLAAFGPASTRYLHTKVIHMLHIDAAQAHPVRDRESPAVPTLYPTLFERLAHASVDVEGLTADVIDEPPEMDSKRRAPRQATRP